MSDKCNSYTVQVYTELHVPNLKTQPTCVHFKTLCAPSLTYTCYS